MKIVVSIILIVILFLILPFSCKKHPDINPAKDIAGHWRWLSYYLVYTLSDSNPLTPQNTGINEILIFNQNHTWKKTQNNHLVDSGTFTIGHGKFQPYFGSYTYIFDSICYYFNNNLIYGGIDFYDIHNDTLQICPCYAGRYASYSIPYNGSKFYIKQE